MKIPKPTAFSFPVSPPTKVRFGIEYSGTLSNTSRLSKFRNFVSRPENPKRVSFIVTDGTSYFEPLGILKKEIRSNDPQADQFLKIFQSDNKNAKILRLLFFREEGTALTDKPFREIDKPFKRLETTSDNLLILGLILAGVTIVILSDKKQKR